LVILIFFCFRLAKACFYAESFPVRPLPSPTSFSLLFPPDVVRSLDPFSRVPPDVAYAPRHSSFFRSPLSRKDVLILPPSLFTFLLTASFEKPHQGGLPFPIILPFFSPSNPPYSLFFFPPVVRSLSPLPFYIVVPSVQLLTVLSSPKKLAFLWKPMDGLSFSPWASIFPPPACSWVGFFSSPLVELDWPFYPPVLLNCFSTQFSSTCYILSSTLSLRWSPPNPCSPEDLRLFFFLVIVSFERHFLLPLCLPLWMEGTFLPVLSCCEVETSPPPFQISLSAFAFLMCSKPRVPWVLPL